MMTKRTTRMEHLAIILIIVVATLYVYWPVCHYDFVNFDDDEYVYHNEYVLKKISFENFIWAFSVNDKNGSHWHPLTWLSHMMDCRLFGLSPGRHHLTNLCFHVLNSLLLFLSLRLMTGSVWRSGFVAMLFALHPINVDSVAWIAQRKSVLSTFFWLLTISAYTFYARHPGFYRYILVVIVFFLGLMAKPMLLTLPFVLLLLDYWPLERVLSNDSGSSGKKSDQKNLYAGVYRVVREKIPLILLCLFLLFMSRLSLRGTAASIESIPIFLRIENATVSYLIYLWKMLWPFNLAVYYPYPAKIPIYQVLGSAFVLAAVTFWALSERIKKPYIIVGWLWFLGTILPVSGIIQVGLWPAVADRWAYVPFMGMFIVFIWLMCDIFAGRKKKTLAFLITGVLFFFAVLARLQVGHWADSISLWQNTINVTSNNSVAQSNMGKALMDRGDVNSAIPHLLNAIKIQPDFFIAYNNLGNAYMMQGRIDDAIACYRKALDIFPNYAIALNNLGIAMAYEGEIEKAVIFFQKALKINPGYAEAYNNLRKIKKN